MTESKPLPEKVQRLLELNRSGLSLTKCAEELGVHPVTVSKWVREHDLEVIRHKRSKEPEKWEDRTCNWCKKTFSIQRSQKRRFCSRQCTNDWQRAQVEARRCEGCGEPIELQPGATTMYTYRKFCSEQCRKDHGGKRQKDPAKWVTFNCETCGEQTTKRISSGNQNRFCSNRCAAKHTKKVRHIVVENAVVLDSGWEALFYGLMAFCKIPCTRYDRDKVVEWGEGHWYAPDFAVVIDGLEIAVEIKGVQDEHDSERWQAYREDRGLLVVLDHTDLDRLRQSETVRHDLYEAAA